MILRALLAPVLMVGLLFLVAGTWNYWQAWVYLIINTILLVLMSTILSPNAELVEERLNPKQGMKGWDKFYFAVTTPLYVIALLLAGLTSASAGRQTCRLPSIGRVPLFTFLGRRSSSGPLHQPILLERRADPDRPGQTVCKDGPYKYVRHPGYVGGFLFTITVGLVLGSWYASIPQVIAALMLVWRTAREDRTLQTELPGYAEFAKETRYRLVPGLW